MCYETNSVFEQLDKIYTHMFIFNYFIVYTLEKYKLTNVFIWW